MTLPITYTNKKGVEVELTLTNHALDRLYERWSTAFVNHKMPDDLTAWVAFQFSEKVSRVTNLNRQEKERVKKHKGATLFFRANEFTYVVQGNSIVTIELCAKNKRRMNKHTTRRRTRGQKEAGNV